MNIKNLYIKELVVDNYKSLKDSKIEFQKGLNLVIGKNGAGKSNLLEFIYRNISRNLFTRLRFSRSMVSNFYVSIEYTQNRKVHEFSYSIERLKRNEPSISNESLFSYAFNVTKRVSSVEIFSRKIITNEKNVRKLFSDDLDVAKEFQVLRLLEKSYITFKLPENSFWISQPNRITIDNIDKDVTFEDSDSEYSFLSSLEFELEFEVFQSIPEKTLKNNLLLKKYVSTYLKDYLEKSGLNNVLKVRTPIQEIRFNRNLNVYSNDQLIIIENLSIEFLIENDWMPWSYLSDGTKRLFYLISEVISRDQGLILVEEPELGIHPHQLFKILEFLKEQSVNKQIIISTHSPSALDILSENELSRICIASYDKGTKFHKLTKRQSEKAKKYMTEVGDLSYYWLHSDLEK